MTTVTHKPFLPCLCAFLLSLSTATAAEESPRHYQIEPQIHYQTIDNFGASDCWSIQFAGLWSDDNREKIADLLFSQDKGIGLSCWRMNLGGGINTQTIERRERTSDTFLVSPGVYDWSRCSGQVWMALAAARRGVKDFVAFVNSPPMSMTGNGLTTCPEDDSITTNLPGGREQDFATYLADVLQHFTCDVPPQERIPFDYVSPLNEPENPWTPPKQEGNRAGRADMRRVYTAVYDTLAARGLPVQVLGPETPSIFFLYDGNVSHGERNGQYIQQFCDDPEMVKVLNKRLAYHSYGADTPESMIRDRASAKKLLDTHPDWSLWHTEYCIMNKGRDLGIDSALVLARQIHLDMALMNATAWQWWLALSPYDYKDGLLYTDWQKPGDPETVYPSKMLWAMGNYSRYVRPGMQRIGFTLPTGEGDGLMGTAYEGADGSIVIVCVNMRDEDVAMVLDYDSGQDGPQTFTPYLTGKAEDENLKPCPTVSIGQTITIPARSIITYVGTPRPTISQHPFGYHKPESDSATPTRKEIADSMELKDFLAKLEIHGSVSATFGSNGTRLFGVSTTVSGENFDASFSYEWGRWNNRFIYGSPWSYPGQIIPGSQLQNNKLLQPKDDK